MKRLALTAALMACVLGCDGKANGPEPMTDRDREHWKTECDTKLWRCTSKEVDGVTTRTCEFDEDASVPIRSCTSAEDNFGEKNWDDHVKRVETWTDGVDRRKSRKKWKNKFAKALYDDRVTEVTSEDGELLELIEDEDTTAQNELALTIPCDVWEEYAKIFNKNAPDDQDKLSTECPGPDHARPKPGKLVSQRQCSNPLECAGCEETFSTTKAGVEKQMEDAGRTDDVCYCYTSAPDLSDKKITEVKKLLWNIHLHGPEGDNDRPSGEKPGATCEEDDDVIPQPSSDGMTPTTKDENGQEVAATNQDSKFVVLSEAGVLLDEVDVVNAVGASSYEIGPENGEPERIMWTAGQDSLEGELSEGATRGTSFARRVAPDGQSPAVGRLDRLLTAMAWSQDAGKEVAYGVGDGSDNFTLRQYDVSLADNTLTLSVALDENDNERTLGVGGCSEVFPGSDGEIAILKPSEFRMLAKPFQDDWRMFLDKPESGQSISVLGTVTYALATGSRSATIYEADQNGFVPYAVPVHADDEDDNPPAVLDFAVGDPGFYVLKFNRVDLVAIDLLAKTSKIVDSFAFSALDVSDFANAGFVPHRVAATSSGMLISGTIGEDFAVVSCPVDAEALSIDCTSESKPAVVPDLGGWVTRRIYRRTRGGDDQALLVAWLVPNTYRDSCE